MFAEAELGMSSTNRLNLIPVKTQTHTHLIYHPIIMVQLCNKQNELLW